MKRRLKKKLKICCECGKKTDTTKPHGRNNHMYWCHDCIDHD